MGGKLEQLETAASIVEAVTGCASCEAADAAERIISDPEAQKILEKVSLKCGLAAGATLASAAGTALLGRKSGSGIAIGVGAVGLSSYFAYRFCQDTINQGVQIITNKLGL